MNRIIAICEARERINSPKIDSSHNILIDGDYCHGNQKMIISIYSRILIPPPYYL